MIKESNWKYFFLFLLLCDIVYTYIQNSNTMMLDGDMAGIILPIDSYKKVLTDPFGMNVFLHDEVYAAPNRFFIHYLMQKYFQFTPFFFQKFVDPIDSVFLSIVIARTFIHVLIIYLISALISGSKNILNINLIVTALIISPLFQVNGYHYSMAITINSITYTFFYSLPIIFILLYFIPFVDHIYHGKPIFQGCFTNQLLCVLAVVISLGGPLAPPSVILIVFFLFTSLFFAQYRKNATHRFFKRVALAFQSIPIQIRAHFIFITILCFYSLYLGTHNAENLWNPITLQERYSLLWDGLWKTLTKKLGVPLLLGVCIVNVVLVFRLKNEISIRTTNFIRLLSLFSLCYILLLPFGGYRTYRPFIIRFDTFSPVTISMMIVFGLTFLILLAHYKGKFRKMLIFALIVIGAIYTNADRYEKNVNKCQKDYLHYLAYSSDSIVELHGWCSLLTWDKIKDPQTSQNSSELIQYWKITKEKKLHFHPD